MSRSVIGLFDRGSSSAVRILYVINGFDPGGAEHGLLTLIEHDAFEGHNLHVLALCRGRGGLADRVVENLGKGRVHFVTNRELLTIQACMAGFFRIFVEALSLRPKKIVLSLKQANLVGRLAAIALPHITCVTFEHIAEYRARRLQGLYGPLLRLLSWRVDEIWADCAETLNQTRRYFIHRRRAGHVIPLFVADGKGPCKRHYALGLPLRLAAAGRLVARKNVALLIDTVASLRAIGVDAVLYVYGDGPEKKTIEDLIAERNLQDRVTLYGYRADWQEQAVNADIFLNVSDAEGFCIVVAEAMLAGLPVIAVDVGGVRDYGRADQNMLKLASPRIDDVRAAILRIMGDSALRERLGRQARRDMLREYDEDELAKRMVVALAEDPRTKCWARRASS
jgi:glycosyltransferase involved in cell wall biosynthesis